MTRSKCTMTFMIISNDIFFNYSYLLCVCRGVDTHMPWYIWRSEDILLKSILSFHHMGPWDQTQLLRLGHIDLPSHYSVFHIAFILLIFSVVYLGLPVHLFNILKGLLHWRLLKECLKSLILVALVIL